MVITCDDELHQEEMPTSRTLLPPRILNASRVILHPPTGTSNQEGEFKILHLKLFIVSCKTIWKKKQFTQISINMSMIFASLYNSNP